MRGSQFQLQPQLQKPSKYTELKQLEYMKQLLRKNEDLHLKQILPIYINKFYIQEFEHEKYIYLPEKNWQDGSSQFKCGVPIETSVKKIEKKIYVYRIERKIQEILKNVFMVNVPVLNRLKALDKFNLLMECKLENFVFNRYIYKKGQHFTGIYFIIQGEVKIIDQKFNTPLRILHKHTFIGLHQLCNETQTYRSTVVSNSNTTKVLFISASRINEDPEHHKTINKNLKEMFIQYYEKQKENKENLCQKYKMFESLFQEEKEEGVKGIQGKLGKVGKRKGSGDIFRYSLFEQKNQKDKQKQRDKEKENVKVHVFVRKWEDFVKNKAVQDCGFHQFMKSRKMMFQLRNSMSSAKLNQQQRNKMQNISTERIEPLNLKKSKKTNSNICSNRSQLYKERILKRLQFSKCQNFNNSEITKVLSESIFIEGNFKK